MYLKCPTRYADYAYGGALGMILSGDKEKAKELAEIAYKYRPIKRNKTLVQLSEYPIAIASMFLRVTFLVRQLW